MKPRNEVEKIFENYGQVMKFKTENGEKVFKAFLQPLRYKNKMYLSAASTELRYDCSRKYLLLAPCEIDLNAADGYKASLFSNGSKYIVDRTEIIYLSGKPIYAWAVVTAI